MAAEVSFKAYLSKEGEDSKPEVRRFSLDQNVATSFLYLKEKLRSLFTPLVVSQSFDIYWKDSDGDYVTICSDEELTIALTESREDQVMKVYIRNVQSAGPAPGNTSSNGPNHEGVFCDSCNNQISGFRYKCLGCHDYDLCSKCEARGLHGEHFTLRIPAPLNRRHHFGHRLINKISKAARRAESKCPWTHQYEHNLAADFNTNCSTGEAPSPRPHCFRARASATTGTGETGSPQGEAGRRGSTQSCADPKECGNTCGASQGSAGASITIDPTQIPNVIFNTLADFGIDLSAFFPPPPPSAQNTSAASTSNEQTKEEPKKKPETKNTPTDESSAPKIAKMTTTPVEPTAPSAANVSAEPDNRSTRNSLLDDWTVYNPNDAQEPTVEPQPIEIDLELEMNSPAGSVMGEKEKEAAGVTTSQPMETGSSQTGVAPNPTEGASASRANLYPSLAGLPKNKKVAEALDQMLAMGFKNDDGWLTNLLNLQDGSIPKVLDLIQSAAQRKP